MKNAYLIIAHNHYELLMRLVKQLDYVGNDIFVHIDKKVEPPDFEKYKSITNHSQVIFVDRKEIVWGQYGLVEAIYELLKTAKRTGRYDYYHLISGVDVPLKSNKYIDSFLERHAYDNLSGGGMTNYINYHVPSNKTEYFPVCHYNIFVQFWSNRQAIIRKMAKGSALLFNYLQFFVNRLGELKQQLYKGDNWWSITDDMADVFIKNEEWARQNFDSIYTFASEEWIFPTLAKNSPLSDTLYIAKNDARGNMRQIDWKRGTPYVWRMVDFDELIKTDAFFARKFDPAIDDRIITKLYGSIHEDE